MNNIWSNVVERTKFGLPALRCEAGEFSNYFRVPTVGWWLGHSPKILDLDKLQT